MGLTVKVVASGAEWQAAIAGDDYFAAIKAQFLRDQAAQAGH